MAARQTIIHWSISSFFGWGVYGLNLALQWAQDPDLEAAAALPIVENHLAIDALRRAALAGFLARSQGLTEQMKALPPGRPTGVNATVLHCVGHDFVPETARHGATLHGAPSIGVTFFNETHLPADAVARAAAYPVVVAGSAWNQRLLEAHGLTNVRLVIQGIDPALFHPAPRQGLLGDRFLVFSGGKLERRKGQDIVMAAFARFAARHPDALLVTAWHSPWPAVARTLDASGLAAPVTLTPEGRVDAVGWARANGVGAANILDLGIVPNALLPPLLREMDVAVFPNRSEGGTNLVAMEAMACGVPTILSRNTGHLDLIDGENGYTLDRQSPLTGDEGPFGDVDGWGESDVDELVETLERAYADRDDARRRGLAGAETLSRFTWAETARQMKTLILEAS